jgi:hypothetical protein
VLLAPKAVGSEKRPRGANDDNTKRYAGSRTGAWYADQQIKEIKYPPQIRKLVGRFSWIIWGALVAVIVAGLLGRIARFMWNILP